MSLWLAGETGQAALALSGESAGLRAAVDQHEASLRDALGGQVTTGVLMSYARGFVEAAVAGGWWPTPTTMATMAMPSDDWLDAVIAAEAETTDADLDWESLRLAAVCRLFLETQGLSPR